MGSCSASHNCSRETASMCRSFHADGCQRPEGQPGHLEARLVGVAHTPKRPTRRRSMKPLFVEAGRVRGRAGAPPGQAGPEGVSAGAQQAITAPSGRPRSPRIPSQTHGTHPHDRRATYDHVNRADEQPGANHHGAHGREHLPGPEWRLRQRPREQRGDRYHPAPAPSAKRVTGAANCSPNSTFVTYIAGSQSPALAISSARQGLRAACLSAVRSTAWSLTMC